MESPQENSQETSPVVTPNADSILISIKKLLGIEADYTNFDVDLIIHINSVFSILNQLGVGPDDGFSIEDVNDEWTDFMEADPRLELAKSYIYLKVKQLFDPPLGSAVSESMNRMISEFEWRLQLAAESNETTS